MALKDSGGDDLTKFLFCSSPWLVKMAAGSWKMAVDFHKPNYVETPATAAISDAVPLMGKISSIPDI